MRNHTRHRRSRRCCFYATPSAPPAARPRSGWTNIRDIKTDNPDLAELELWHQASGLPLKKFFNTSGQLYRSLELSKKLPGMSDAEQYALLASDGMLVKRPILITDDNKVLVGFKEDQWAETLG